MAQISKNAGGIGIAFTKVRAKGTYIAGTNGTSNGIIPFLKIYNETAIALVCAASSSAEIALTRLILSAVSAFITS